MKKVVSLLVAAVMVMSCAMLAGCGSAKQESGTQTQTEEKSAGKSKSDIKIGFICLHDENSTYDKNFIDAANAAKKSLGLSDSQVMFKTNIPESNECYEAAASLVDAGCDIVFADSFGHEDFMIQAAKEFPDVVFAHATGTKAHTEKLPNFYNAFASIYEGRFLAGVAAGLKINEMIESGKITADQTKMGYVGAYPYAEVVSGYTAFFLGIQSIVPNVTMEVSYTNSWFDITMEGAAADALMADGCVIIGQHADSTGAPSAVQAAFEKGNVAYSIGSNVDMLSVAPDAALTSATNNWGVFYKYAFSTMLKGEKLATNWAEGFNSDAVAITELGKSCAAGTAEKVAEVEKQLRDGTLHVFDTSKFTVGGEHLDSYDKSYGFEGHELISDGYFHESELRSAPAFDIRIDGIKELA